MPYTRPFGAPLEDARSATITGLGRVRCPRPSKPADNRRFARPGYPTFVWRLPPGAGMGKTDELYALSQANSVDLSRDDLRPLQDAAKDQKGRHGSGYQDSTDRSAAASSSIDHRRGRQIGQQPPQATQSRADGGPSVGQRLVLFRAKSDCEQVQKANAQELKARKRRGTTTFISMDGLTSVTLFGAPAKRP